MLTRGDFVEIANAKKHIRTDTLAFSPTDKLSNKIGCASKKWSNSFADRE